MSRRVANHLRSQAFGYLVLFVVLGGTAFAAGTQRANTVGSIDIIDGEVKTVDLGADAVVSSKVLDGTIGSADVLDNSLNSVDMRNGQVASIDVANGSLTGADVADNGLTGADVDESSLDLATEAWHEIGAAGEPGFNDSGFCSWTNFDPTNFATAAFARDRHGIVRLKGRVKAVDGSGCNFGAPEDQLIFTLPPGYRPEKRDAEPVLTNFAFGRVNVDVGGQVSVDPPTTETNARVWLSLDGIAFRCLPSGTNGCP
jgi:hypothetical protein